MQSHRMHVGLVCVSACECTCVSVRMCVGVHASSDVRTKQRCPHAGVAPLLPSAPPLPQERPRSAPHARRGSSSAVAAAPEYSFKPQMNEVSRQITDMSYPKDR